MRCSPAQARSLPFVSHRNLEPQSDSVFIARSTGRAIFFARIFFGRRDTAFFNYVPVMPLFYPVIFVLLRLIVCKHKKLINCLVC
jgi:hypothetical protein